MVSASFMAGRKVHGDGGRWPGRSRPIHNMDRVVSRLFAAVALVGCLILFFGISAINVSALVAVDFTPETVPHCSRFSAFW